MAEDGCHVVALDIDRDYVVAANKVLERYPDCAAVQSDILAFDTEARFDTVVMLDVLEHIEHDDALLQRLRALLAPGGRIILKVPAGAWLYGAADRDLGHHRRYSKSVLLLKAKSAQLKPVHEPRYFNRASVPGWWLNGRLLRRGNPPKAQIAWLEYLVPLFRLMEKAIPLPFGLSIIVALTPE